MAALGNKPRPEAVGSAPRAQPQAAAVARGGWRQRPAGEEAGRFGGPGCVGPCRPPSAGRQ